MSATDAEVAHLRFLLADRDRLAGENIDAARALWRLEPDDDDTLTSATLTRRVEALDTRWRTAVTTELGAQQDSYRSKVANLGAAAERERERLAADLAQAVTERLDALHAVRLTGELVDTLRAQIADLTSLLEQARADRRVVDERAFQLETELDERTRQRDRHAGELQRKEDVLAELRRILVTIERARDLALRERDAARAEARQQIAAAIADRLAIRRTGAADGIRWVAEHKVHDGDPAVQMLRDHAGRVAAGDLTIPTAEATDA